MASEIESWASAGSPSGPEAGPNAGPNPEQGSRPLEQDAQTAGMDAAPDTSSGTSSGPSFGTASGMHSDTSSESGHPPSDRPPSDEAPPPASGEAPPRRRGWLPAGVSFLGAGVAGGGLVLAALGIASLFISRDNGVSALDARLAALELQIRDLAAPLPPLPPAAPDAHALDDLAARLGKLETAGADRAPAAPDGAVTDRIGALEGEVKALAETVAVLGRRGDEALAAAREARTHADATAAAVAALTQKVAGMSGVDRGTLDALANRLAALERSEQAVAGELAKRSAAERGDQAVRLALAATALKSAVERGDAFTAELATVKALAADPKLVAVLEPFASSGVPAAPALARELGDLSPAILQAVGAPQREGFLQKLQVNAEKLVRIRPLEETAGTDPAAIVSRAEFKVSHGDVAGALADLARLPAPAQAPAEAWIAKAKARTAAIDASRRLASDALAGLGK